MSERENIFDWNHVSNKLTDRQISELKSYYKAYHRKCWAYKMATKRLEKWKILGNSLSVIFATGGIASAVATSGVSLIAISTTSILIQTWMKHKNIDLKIHTCTYAYQSYEHLLNDIKNAMRSGDFHKNSLLITMNSIDDYIIDITPVVDKYLLLYDKKFIG